MNEQAKTNTELIEEISGLKQRMQEIGRAESDRKQVEEALRESKELYRICINATSDMVFLKDEQLRNLVINKAMAAFYGKPEGEIIGKSNFELMPQIAAEKCRLTDLEALSKQSTSISEEIIGDHWYETLKSPVELGHNRVGLVGFIRDITRRKKSGKQLQDTLESLRKSMSTTIQVLVSTVEARDPYTAGHQIKSANLARAIATEMGLSQEVIEGIRMAGSIHDIGKISIPAEILSKPTKLSELEFALIKEHTQKGFDMLKDVESPWPLAEIVYQHHERMDGSGYPRNLRGDAILIEARIFAVSDVVEAMASHRPYRPCLGIYKALDEIEKNSDIYYDKSVVDACLRLFREKGFTLEGA